MGDDFKTFNHPPDQVKVLRILFAVNVMYKGARIKFRYLAAIGAPTPQPYSGQIPRQLDKVCCGVRSGRERQP